MFRSKSLWVEVNDGLLPSATCQIAPDNLVKQEVLILSGLTTDVKKPTCVGFLKMVGERGLLVFSRLALRVVAKATLSRCARLERSFPGGSHPFTINNRCKKTDLRRFLKYGRRERIRTSDPLVPNQLRYQAALLAEKWGASYCCNSKSSSPFCAFLYKLNLFTINPVTFPGESYTY